MSMRAAKAEHAATTARVVGSFPNGVVPPGESVAGPGQDLPSAEELPVELRWPPFDLAIKHGDASFAQVAAAHFDFLDLDGASPLKQRQSRYYFPRLLDAFYARHGHMVQLILCSHTQAAATLTDRDEIWFKLPRENHDHHEYCKLMMRCSMIYAEARRVLANDPVEKGVCINLLFTVFGYLVNAVDLEDRRLIEAEAAKNNKNNHGTDQRAALLRLAEDMLEQVEGYYRRVAQLLAKRWYFIGMVLGTLAMGLIVAILFTAWNLKVPSVPHTVTNGDAHVAAILVSVIAGGIGACISVMTRMTTGKLVLDHRAPRWLLLKLGAFRVVIGATFGTALFFLLMGGILQMSGPNTNDTEWIYFYAGLAFVAGFSERLAQDMLAVSEKRFTGASDERDEVPKLEVTGRHQP